MEELPRGVHGKRRRLFSMERAQADKILRSSLFQLDVVANHADNVRLLPHRFFKVAESRHEPFTSFCLKNHGSGMPELWCTCRKPIGSNSSSRTPFTRTRFQPGSPGTSIFRLLGCFQRPKSSKGPCALDNDYEVQSHFLNKTS